MRVLIYSIIFLIVSGCGFKIINQSESQRYKISDVELKGEKRINYFIKNRLLKKSSNGNLNNEIALFVTTKKIKSSKKKILKMKLQNMK